MESTTERLCRLCGELIDEKQDRDVCRRCVQGQAYLPTEEEIAAAAAEIRRGWNATTERQRRVIGELPPVEITRWSASI